MKKLLFVTNGIMLMLLLLSHTINKNKNEAGSPTAYVDTKLGIDPELARDMVANYRDYLWKSRKVRNQSQIDSRSVWFSLYKLKKFINDIEATLQKAGCRPDSLDLGIRIYYGSYPDNMQRWGYFSNYTTAHKLPDLYMGLHSVVMVPTLYNPDDSFHYDFDPRWTDGKCRPKPIREVMDSLTSLKKKNIVLPDHKSPLFEGNVAYMIMPDNLDNKALFNKSFTLSNSRSGAGRGPAYFPAAGPPPTDPSFANAGTLIPPPYPENMSVSLTAPGSNPNPTTQSYIKMNYGLNQKFHVPYSGASFMRWVDGTNSCGWNEVPIGMKTENKNPTGFQPE